MTTTSLTPSMLQLLRAEFTDDPAARGYPGLTAGEQADRMNTPYAVTGPQQAAVATDITIAALEAVIVPTGELFKISQLAATTPTGVANDVNIAAAWSLMLMVQKWTTITTSDAATWVAWQANLTALEGAGVLSSASVQAITAQVMKVPEPTVTEHNARVMEIFMGVEDAPNVVSSDDVAEALAL